MGIKKFPHKELDSPQFRFNGFFFVLRDIETGESVCGR